MRIIKSYKPCKSIDYFISKAIRNSVSNDLFVNVNAELISREETRKSYNIIYSYLKSEKSGREITYQNYVSFAESVSIDSDDREDIATILEDRLLYLETRINQKGYETENGINGLMIYSPRKKIMSILR